MSDYAATWDALLIAATLGSERRPPAPPESGGQLGALLAALDWSDAEGALLGASATTAIGGRAGRLPPRQTGGAFAAAAPDEQRECSEAAAQHLALMLEGGARQALPEWLARLAALGLRAPAEQLPALLDHGQSQEALRPQIIAVLGRRGRWLAGLNPAWSYADESPAGAPAALVWETGSRPARLAALRAVRAASPEAGRELLATTWATEKADDRAAFLAALRAGLGPDDEALLDAALDDRSKEVRATAAELLSQLPGAQIAARMEQRLLPLLRWTPAERPNLLGLRMGRPAKLVAALPEACGKELARDGVEPKPRGTALGERAWWLAQMIAAVPPTRWSQQWQAAPDALVRAALQHELADALLSGWWAATSRHPDAAWAEALITHCGERALTPIVDGGRQVPPLVGQLPAERLEQLAIEALGRGPEGFALLASDRRPWSAALTRAAAAALQAAIRRSALNVWTSTHILQQIAERAPPELHTELARGWPRDAAQWPQWEGYVVRCHELIEFRYHALRALQES